MPGVSRRRGSCKIFRFTPESSGSASVAEHFCDRRCEDRRAMGWLWPNMYPTVEFAAQYGLINSSLTNFEQFFVPPYLPE
jgi:hypothetical protein